ncbi:MAG: MFS transporter, partial [Lactobacillus iners]|nr:MFS transporter [Lactobacillus iners]
KLADQRGRKLMILRSSIGMAIAIGSMGFVTNVYQLFCLRMLQGFFAGFVSNANALIATESPKNQAGKAMGTMAASFTAGNLLGPLLGGLLASMFTYHFTFLLTGILLFISFILSFLFVKEEFKPISKQSV